MTKEFFKVQDGSKKWTLARCCATTKYQALLANVEELTCQNEELRKMMESQNAECRRIGENQNEGELNSQANRQDRTSREDFAKIENEFCNMRK